jgi:hypothetical protein
VLQSLDVGTQALNSNKQMNACRLSYLNGASELLKLGLNKRVELLILFQVFSKLLEFVGAFIQSDVIVGKSLLFLGLKLE